MATNVEDFWSGYVEAIEAMETRVAVLRASVDSHSKPIDIVLDMANELKELKAIHLDHLTSISE